MNTRYILLFQKSNKIVHKHLLQVLFMSYLSVMYNLDSLDSLKLLTTHHVPIHIIS